jgi:hypothetical protein
MSSKRVNGLILAASAAGLLALSAGAANASAPARHVLPDSPPAVTIIWEGPESSEATCLALVAYEEKQPNTLSASCSYRDYAPIQLGGAYDPGWYNYLAVESSNE